MKVAIAQIKPKLLNLEENIKKHLKYINLGREKGVDLIVFPELSLTGYLTGWLTPLISINEKSKEIKILRENTKGISAIIGAIFEEKGQFYNSAIFFEDGEIIGIHKKVYLPTYGMFDEGRFFTRGNGFFPIEGKLGSFGILICEDAWHLEGYLSYSKCDYVVIITDNPFRIVGEKDSINVWHSLADIPSTFFGIPTIYANRVGVEDGVIFFGKSKIIEGDGKVLAEGKVFEEDFIIGEFRDYISKSIKFRSATLREHVNALWENTR